MYLELIVEVEDEKRVHPYPQRVSACLQYADIGSGGTLGLILVYIPQVKSSSINHPIYRHLDLINEKQNRRTLQNNVLLLT